MDSGFSSVVTGGAQGVGRAIAECLASVGSVVVLDVAAATWRHENIRFIVGDASDPGVTRRAAAAAEEAAPLTGWVNNAAIFRDASLVSAEARQVLDLITANLALALVGSQVAVNHFLSHGRPGAIVNVSSHQGQRPVRGALPYATAKAAVEGLTRAIAVDHGPSGVRRTPSPSDRSRPHDSSSTGCSIPRWTRPWPSCIRSAG